MKEEKDKWESLIRSKMYDFEVDTNPEDWDLIASKLPDGKMVSFRPYRRYISIAAAAVAVLLLTGSFYFYLYDTQETRDVVAVVEKPVENKTEPVEKVAKSVENKTESVEKVAKSVEKNVEVVEKSIESQPSMVAKVTDVPVEKPTETAAPDESVVNISIPDVQPDEALLAGFRKIDPERISLDEQHLLAVVTPDVSASKEVKRRRWGFGMGGGGLGVSSVTTGLNVRSQSVSIGDDEYEKLPDVMFLRGSGQDSQGLFDNDEGAVSLNEINNVERSLGKIKHKMPISTGLGVSYYLNDRWALQSGLVYTLLRSTGSYNNSLNNYVEWKQHLHYLGIPLSATYKIAEWNRLQLYTTGGGMCEFNVSGKLKETVVDEQLRTKRNDRMKKPLWSVNACTGIDYPLWKILYIYVEGGVSYYFDNHSDIETIRSDKPFNFSLQAGFRIGF